MEQVKELFALTMLYLVCNLMIGFVAVNNSISRTKTIVEQNKEETINYMDKMGKHLMNITINKDTLLWE